MATPLTSATLAAGNSGVPLAVPTRQASLPPPDVLEAQLNAQMIQAAREVSVIADATKFGRRSLSLIGDIRSIHRVITDSRVNEEVVCQLSANGAPFWVEDESLPNGNFSPQTLGGSTERLLLITEEPGDVIRRAVELGATEVSPLAEEYGWLLGRIDDPFGHRWEIGKPLGAWPPGKGGEGS